MTEAYYGPQVVGMDLHRRRSVLVRMTADGKRLETARITNSAAELRREIAKAGEHPKVVLEATYCNAAVSRARSDASVDRWAAGTGAPGARLVLVRSRWIWSRMSGWV